MMALITREEMAGLARSLPRFAAFAAGGFQAFTPPGRRRSALAALALASCLGAGGAAEDLPRPVRLGYSDGFAIHGMDALPGLRLGPDDVADMVGQELGRMERGRAMALKNAAVPAMPSVAAVPVARVLAVPAAAQASLPLPPAAPARVADAEAPVPLRLQRAVEHAGQRTGLDPAALLTLAWMETRISEHARNPESTATGPFQFLRVAWFEAVMRFGADHGYGALSARIAREPDGTLVVDRRIRRELMDLRDDPRAAALMAAASIASARPSVEAVTGRPMELADMYVVHLLGTSGAMKFLGTLRSAGSTPCSAVVPDAMRGNWNLFAREGRVLSVADAYQGIDSMVRARQAGYAALFHQAPRMARMEHDVEVASAGPAMR